MNFLHNAAPIGNGNLRLKSARKRNVFAVPDYLLDACAVLALLNDEEGAELVGGLLDRAERGVKR